MTAYFHTEEAVIRAPAARCYDLLLAIRRYGEWWPGARWIPLDGAGLLRVGSRLRCAAGSLSWVTEVSELLPYRGIELRYVDGDLRGPVRWQLDAADGGTRVRHLFRGVQLAGPNADGAFAALRAFAASVRTHALAGMQQALERSGSDVSGGDLFEALHSQPAVRAFRPEPIADAVLREILAAATRAPSARNAQPWFFVAVRDPVIKAEVGRHYLAAWRQAQAFTAQLDADADIKDRPGYAGMMRRVDQLAGALDRAPVLVLCCLDLTQLGPMADSAGYIRAPQSAYASIFPAVQNLMLAARGLGIGSTLTTVYLGAEADLRRAVGIPEHVHIAALVPLGYPVRPFRITTRKPVDEVAFLDRWGRPFPPSDGR